MKLKQLYRILSPKFQKLCMEYPVDLKPRWGRGGERLIHNYIA